MRKAVITRKTKETDIKLSLNLDGSGKTDIKTSIPFLDHMLTLFGRHGNFDLSIEAKGDIEVDSHHLIEDIGITLGEAINKALKDKKGIQRYSNFLLPMDEALSYIAIDISGRPYLDYRVKFKRETGSNFNFSQIHDFFIGVVSNAKITLHISMQHGRSNHHIAESIFKGFGVALNQAVKLTGRRKEIPSTKGSL